MCFIFIPNLAFWTSCVLLQRKTSTEKKKKNRWNTSVTQKEKIILKDYKKSK